MYALGEINRDLVYASLQSLFFLWGYLEREEKARVYDRLREGLIADVIASFWTEFLLRILFVFAAGVFEICFELFCSFYAKLGNIDLLASRYFVQESEVQIARGNEIALRVVMS